jgi:hypothetical protein
MILWRYYPTRLIPNTILFLLPPNWTIREHGVSVGLPRMFGDQVTFSFRLNRSPASGKGLTHRDSETMLMFSFLALHR